MHRQTHEHPDSSPNAARRVLMLLTFKVTRENNSKEVNTAREGDSRASQARNLCLLSQSRHLGGGVKDKRSEVTGGGRQLVTHLQDTTEEGTVIELQGWIDGKPRAMTGGRGLSTSRKTHSMQTDVEVTDVPATWFFTAFCEDER